MGLSSIISVLAAILRALLGIPSYFKRLSLRRAYREADKAEKKQAKAEEELAARNAEDYVEDELKKRDDEFWKGGSDY